MMIVNFTKEQIDFVKHCGEHFEVLTGGRGHSKTKQIIEQLQQENARLKDKLNEIKKVIDGYMPNEHAMCKAFDEIEFIIKEN